MTEEVFRDTANPDLLGCVYSNAYGNEQKLSESIQNVLGDISTRIKTKGVFYGSE